MIYDAVIIGTGAAGLSAALTLKANGKTMMWFGNPNMSEKTRRAERVFNYPGLPEVSGQQLAEAFADHVSRAGLTVTDKMVTSVMYMGGHYYVTAQDDFFEAHTVLLATGVAGNAEISGEARLLGRGVSYCATCDGMLYRGKTIAVVSNSAHFEHEVAFLAELAGKVYFFPQYAGNQIRRDNVQTVLQGISEVCGDRRVSHLKLKSGEELPVDGIFCLRTAIAPTTLLPGLEVADGHIAVDRQMRTNLPGCFAAGDCTGRPYQYTKAAGEGNVAAHSIVQYLAQK